MDIFNDAQRHICADLQCCTFCTLGIHADAVTSQARYSRVVHLHVSARYSRQSPMNRQTCSCAAPSAVLCCACASTCAAPGPQRATRAHFTWGVKNPHRKGHFANYWTYNCFGRSCFELWNLLNQPTPPSLNNLFVEYIRIRTFAGLYLTFPSGDGR